MDQKLCHVIIEYHKKACQGRYRCHKRGFLRYCLMLTTVTMTMSDIFRDGVSSFDKKIMEGEMMIPIMIPINDTVDDIMIMIQLMIMIMKWL